MGLDLYISARRKALAFKADGSLDEFEDERTFNAASLRSRQVVEICKADNPAEEYKKIVLDSYEDVTENLYDFDGDICGTCVSNYGKDNVSAFEKWVEVVQSLGYAIYFELG